MKNSKLLLKTALISSMAVAPLAFGNGGIHPTQDSAMNSDAPTTERTRTTDTTDGAIVTDETSSTASAPSTAPVDTATEAAAMNLPSSVIKNAEQKLSEKGFTISRIDGVMDEETRSAVEKFQIEKELKVTSMLNEETLDELDVDYEDAVEARKERVEYSE